MYAVVGCSDCQALWIVEGRPETTECRRCGTRHRFEHLKRFVETDDRAAAREARGRMLAERDERGEAFAEVDSSGDPASEDVGVDDEAYLRQSGVDPEEVAEAGEQATRSGGSQSRREVVMEALREQDTPTEREVVVYAEARGVPTDYVRKALEKLREAGEISERDGGYRLL